MDMPKPDEKSFAISKLLVWEAWRQVKANKGAPGVDGQALEEFEADLADNLYKVWNRMSSGTWFPPPVRAVAIPKPHGAGVQNAGRADDRGQGRADGGGQLSGGRVESRFHPDSYGYRPKKSAHDALAGMPAAVLEVRLGDRSRRPEVLRHRAVGSRAASGPGGHRLPLGVALCAGGG